MVQYIYKPITNRVNFGGKRPKSAIKFIVLHWTSNTAPTATALNHYKYFQNHNVEASAHYFVDNDNIVQIVGDTTVAYAVEGNQGYGIAINGCNNYNSISIEMCVNKGYNETLLFNVVELTKELLRQYPNAKLCRHWDCTRKNCPEGWTGKNNPKWLKFLEDIKKNRRMILDLTQNSVGILVDKNINIQNNNKINVTNKKVEKEGGYSVLTRTPGDVLNVREKPEANSKKVSSYRDKSKIYVHEVIHTVNGTWYKIEYSHGRFGYVNAKFCVGIK